MSPPNLLTLPAEIRQQIWEYSLTSPTGKLRYDANKKRFDVSKIGAGLLSVSHSLAAETYYLPLQLNTLVVNMSRHDEFQPELEILLSRLRALEQEACCVFRIKYDFQSYFWVHPNSDLGLDFKDDGGITHCGFPFGS